MTTLPRLTASRLRDARACQRLHKYRYLDGYQPVDEAAALRFGRLIHLGLEAWFLAPPGERLEHALDELKHAEADPFDLARAEVLMIGYDQRWAHEPMEVIAVEQQFDMALTNPDSGRASQTWQLAGKIDAIIRDGAGRTLIVEHKTSSEDISTGSEYWKKLRIDGQVSVYFEGARSLGHDVAGCLYDVIKKPGLRPLRATPIEKRQYTKDGRLYANQRDQDETLEEFRLRLINDVAEKPNDYFVRGEVVRLESEVQDTLYDIWQLGRQLREAELAARFPRNPDACTRFNRTCAFFGVCTGEASLDDSTQFRRLDNVNPELMQEAS